MASPGIAPVDRLPEISRDEIRGRLRDPTLVVLDVLPSESFRAGHIAGAMSLPVGEIAERAGYALPDRDREIAVYCGSFG
jgi:rhodanese-related sulfurtransferase